MECTWLSEEAKEVHVDAFNNIPRQVAYFSKIEWWRDIYYQYRWGGAAKRKFAKPSASDRDELRRWIDN